MVTSRLARPTDLVLPLDDSQAESDPIAEAEAAAAELDWSYDDAELTMQLRAIKQGRGWILSGIAASVFALGAAVAFAL
jgi:hypothetical protein